jgi:alpha-galactosidase
LQAGEWFAPGEVVLAAGESMSSPVLHVAYSDAGLNGASHKFHDLARCSVLAWPEGKMRARPVHLNTWEAMYFAHDQQALRDLATKAAAIGVERFVLDDGWFPARDHDQAGLGDWWPDPVKYPEGLGPLAAHVNKLGMEFGLWLEPEMVNPDSDLYRAHPDWALQVQGRPLQLGRYQLVLDIARPEVSDYLFDKINTLLAANPISYIKWDMNRDLHQAADASGRQAYSAQVHALYTLLARLRKVHPKVEIESCSSGAARADLGVLRYTHRLWTSDNNDAVSRVAIQSGAARLFPLELLGSHVGPAPTHVTGRSQDIAFRCAIACFGHMGVEADVRQLSKDELQTVATWIAFHKQWRDVLHTGRFSQGQTASGSVWWLAQTDKRALLAVITTTPPDYSHQPPLPLPAFAGTGAWRLRLAQSVGLERARAEAVSPWRDALRSAEGVSAHGDELSTMGLPLPTMNPESVLYYSFEAIQ